MATHQIKIQVPSLQLEIPAPLLAFARSCRAEGGRAWLVGGAVRDALLGHDSKDIDVEVHGIAETRVKALLRRVGRVKEVGRSFGVFKLRCGAEEIDVALPRGDSTPGATGAVRGDPFLGLAAAARRRDLTINAIALCPVDDELEDPCGGLADLRARRMRAADPQTFGDDPLRALRVAQLGARLELTCAPELTEICRQQDLRALPAERIRVELEKLLLRAERPSIGLTLMRQLHLIPQVLPALHGVPPPDTALDRAARVRRHLGAPARQALMWATLLHPCSTDGVEETLEALEIHRLQGYPLRRQIAAAHRHAPELITGWTDQTLCRLAEHAEVGVVAWTAWAISDDDACRSAVFRAAALGVLEQPLPPLLRGRDLLALGVPPGPTLGELLAQVRRARLAGEISNPSEASALAVRLWTALSQPDG